jgi:hypothetical protein
MTFLRKSFGEPFTGADGAAAIPFFDAGGLSGNAGVGDDDPIGSVPDILRADAGRSEVSEWCSSDKE